MITTERVAAVLFEHWAVLGNGDRPPAKFSFLSLTKGQLPLGKVVLLVFGSGDAAPRFVVKVARLKAHNGALESEYLNLTTVAPYATYGRVRAPIALMTWEEGGRLCLVESVIEGRDLSQVASRSRTVPFVMPIVDWLIHLGRGTLRLASPAEHSETMIDTVKRADRHAWTHEERYVLSRVSARLAAIRKQPLPRVFEHRDLGTWNVTVSRAGAIGVLDWESSCPRGFPAWDLFYFLAHCGFVVHGSRNPTEKLRSFQDTFFAHGPFARTARAAIDRYADALGVVNEWLVPLFLGCWVHHAVTDVSLHGVRLADSLFWRLLTTTIERDCRVNFLEA